jgi:hypothetical protein
MSEVQPSGIPQSFHIPEKVLFREVQGEAVLLHLETNAYFRLDAVGTQVWLVMQEVGSFEELVVRLLEDFDATETTVRKDVGELLRNLVSHGLVEPAP